MIGGPVSAGLALGLGAFVLLAVLAVFALDMARRLSQGKAAKG